MPASVSSIKTFSAKAADVERQWHLIDARGQTLGRLASVIAKVLRGKHKPIYTPHVDTGDHIVVINAAEVHLTGNKEEGKVYHHHTGYIGNLKSATVKQVRARHPERLLMMAVKGMLPKSPLGRAQFRKLRIYAGPEHQHEAQSPQPLKL